MLRTRLRGPIPLSKRKSHSSPYLKKGAFWLGSVKMLAANQAYLVSIGVPAEKQEKCLEAMEKYGDNQWWLSYDPKVRAYYQINEDFLLMSFSQFHEDTEKLLNRPVWSHEFAFAFPKLKQEAERAWKYGVGATSDKERQEKFEESIQDLRDMGKDIVIIEIPSEE